MTVVGPAASTDHVDVAVSVVDGDVENLKVTHADDLAAAERILRARREGRGAAWR